MFMSATRVFANNDSILSFLHSSNLARVAAASKDLRTQCRQTEERKRQIFKEALTKLFDDDDSGEDEELTPLCGSEVDTTDHHVGKINPFLQT